MVAAIYGWKRFFIPESTGIEERVEGFRLWKAALEANGGVGQLVTQLIFHVNQIKMVKKD